MADDRIEIDMHGNVIGPPEFLTNRDPTTKLTAEAPEVRETTVTEWHLTSHMLRQLAVYERELAKWTVEQRQAPVRLEAFEEAAAQSLVVIEEQLKQHRNYRNARDCLVAMRTLVPSYIRSLALAKEKADG